MRVTFGEFPTCAGTVERPLRRRRFGLGQEGPSRGFSTFCTVTHRGGLTHVRHYWDGGEIAGQSGAV